MDSISARSRKVEKPKTVTERRASLIARGQKRVESFQGRADAAAMVFGSESPVPFWLRDARDTILDLVEELERTRR